ncbi:bile acid:sodium symporter family protein [Leptospira sp. 96542]|nr:bile acid:sodium symporter family protein [Leptospira sp. 96542]
MKHFFEGVVKAFPLVLLFFSGFGFLFPEWIVWFKGNWITYSLGGIMLGMGLSLDARDFVLILKQPKQVFVGVLLQYTVMPTLGYSLAYLFQLPDAFAIGLILVSCCPGGTASNVIAYLAKADVPLSVTLTSVSTLVAIFLTPLFVGVLVGSRLEVDRWGLVLTTFQVILLPISLGLVLKSYLPKFTKRALDIAPVVSVLLIAMIVSSIIASGKESILHASPRIFLSVVFLHIFGFLLGGILSFVLFRNLDRAKTISIEVGMQNSGLGAVLARAHFLDPNTAIPSALSSLTHSLIGSLFAAYFRHRSEKLPTNS